MPTFQADRGSAVESEALRQKTALLYRNAGIALWATIINAGLLAYVNATLHTPVSVAFVWWFLILLIAVGRYLLAQRFMAARPEAIGGMTWRHRYIGATAMIGAAWGWGAVLFMWQAPENAQLFTGLVFSGMLAGALPILAPELVAFGIFALLVCVPMSAAILLQANSPLHWAFGAMTFVFLLVVLASARFLHQTLDVSIRQGLELEQHRTRLEQLVSERTVELSLAMKDAEAANNAKSRFLAAASHDLRQPLAALRLYADVLRSKVGAPEEGLVASMDDCIANLSGLLGDLLDLSKLDAGVVKPSIADFSVFEQFSSLESVYLPKAQAKGLRLCFVATRVTGCSDPILFKRLLGNFIDNAIRYTTHGGVVVGCRRHQGKTWIEVWDSGIGIAAEQTAQIFEEFKQLGDQARTQGSGLGLAIVAKTAALLGLAISVRSCSGRGSVFGIELPLGQPEAIARQAAPVTQGHSLHIALVEDNPLVRNAMVYTLQDHGHQVVAAATAGALLAELGPWPPDIIVSDYRLGQGKTGFDVITAVREALGEDLPAIIITGDTDPKLLASMSGGGIAVLHKPLAMGELEACLEKLMVQAN